MRSRFSNAFAILSLALFVATMALWVRSYRTSDVVRCWYQEGQATRFIGCRAYPGEIEFTTATTIHQVPSGFKYGDNPKLQSDTIRTIRAHALLGFGFASGQGRSWMDVYYLNIPIWFISLLTSIAPALWFYRNRSAPSHPAAVRTAATTFAPPPTVALSAGRYP